MKFFVPILTSGGYVGLSIATLLSQHHKVMAVDIVPEKVELINNKKSPIQDEYIEKYLAEKELDLTATLDAKEAYSDADFVVIAAPTNYDSKKNFFDTSAVEAVIKLVIEYNPEAIMVIKSTIPVGFTASVREKYHCDNIIFSPEFLRESKALYDNLYPSRIIVGTDVENARLVKAAHTFAELLDFFQQLVVGNDLPVYFALVGADAALFHLAGGWPQMDRGDFINALPLVAAVVNALRSTGRFQRPVGVGCPRCPPNLHISFIVPVGRILSMIFPAAFPIRDTLSILVQIVCLAALCAPVQKMLWLKKHYERHCHLSSASSLKSRDCSFAKSRPAESDDRAVPHTRSRPTGYGRPC